MLALTYMAELAAKSTVRSQIVRGLRMGEAILTSLGLMGGTIIASGHSDYFRPQVGWLLLVICGVVLAFEMKHWVKIVPAIFAYGALLGLRPLFTGHVVNHPEIPESKLHALVFLLGFLSIAILSTTIARRELSRLDRVLLMLFVGFTLWMYVTDSFTAMGTALCCLLVAWTVDYLRRREISRQNAGGQS